MFLSNIFKKFEYVLKISRYTRYFSVGYSYLFIILSDKFLSRIDVQGYPYKIQISKKTITPFDAGSNYGLFCKNLEFIEH